MSLRSLSFMMILSLAVALSGCGSSKKKKAGPDEAITDVPTQENSFELNGDSDNSKAGGLRTVYFDFNSSQLSGETRSTLENNAKFLKDNTSSKIQVEGHCDERGSIQYNLALGERRAKAVKEFLVAKGVNSKRISTISFGKERPVDSGHDEMAWTKNRRGNFVVTAK
ncbi:MAG: peptidoglycan-associated lipoprotein Pal [Pseudomonadota bacterium]